MITDIDIVTTAAHSKNAANMLKDDNAARQLRRQ